MVGPLADLGRQLAGPALVRLSGALWKRFERFDLLGAAIRLRSSDTITPEPAPADQDLLLASFRWVWTLPLAPFSSHPRDFFANDYYAVLPYRVAGLGRIDLRMRPESPVREGAATPRRDRLRDAVAAGRGRFVLEVRARRGLPDRWTPVAHLALEAPVAIDQDQLAFTPFHAGRGLEPAGFFQHVRRATYAASQAARQRAAHPAIRGAHAYSAAAHPPGRATSTRPAAPARPAPSLNGSRRPTPTGSVTSLHG